jgi:hypothetical protein
VPEWEILRAEQQKAAHIEQQFLQDDVPVGAGRAPPVPAVSLARSQSVLWQAITAPCGAKEFLIQADAETMRDFQQIVAQTLEFDRSARVDVYATAYFARLHGVLIDLFPVLHACLGAIPFHNMVTDYLLACPSTSPDVRRIGDRLSEFLHSWQHPRAAALAELAGVELAVVNALDCADAPTLTVSDLAAVPQTAWPSVKLRLHLSVSVNHTELDFVALSRAVEVGAIHESPLLDVDAHESSSAKHAILVWRSGFTVLHREIDSGESAALASALRADSFEELCGAAAAAQEGFQAAQAAEMIAQWLNDGLIVEIAR